MELGTFGNMLLVLASVSAVASVVTYAADKVSPRARKVGHWLTLGIAGFTTIAIVILAVAFLRENWSLAYVIQNHPTLTGPWAWAYRLSGVWAGREGSLLFWEWIISLYAAFLALKFMKRKASDPEGRLGAVGTAVLNFVQLFFLAALFIDQNNPFHAAPAGIVDPATGALLTSAAMNPLLETWAMVLHPPTLFIGYAGLAVPFAFGLAALITGNTSKLWVTITNRITVFSWLMLGAGIGLGAVWAYYELAFGGYWAWDPVENASLLPWLTGVGLVHSMTVYRRREAYKSWTFMMAAFTFGFVMLGTFITRSGIVQSVHAFEEDPLSFWLFLTMIVGALVAMGVGVAKRNKSLTSEHDDFERVMSKEGSYYLNNVIMLFSAIIVAYLTLAPALPTFLPWGGTTIQVGFYDSLARPIGIFYILLMTVCPILSWGGGDWPTFWKRAKMPLIIGTVLAAAFIAAFVFAMLPFYSPVEGTMTWLHHFVAIVGLIVAGYAIALPAWLFVEGVKTRAAASGESRGKALGWLFTKARTQSGGYLTHFGMGVILVGLIGSTMFVSTYEATLAQEAGAKFSAEGYTYTFVELAEGQENVSPTTGVGDTVYTLVTEVSKDGGVVGTVRPQLRYPQQLASQGTATQHVSILHEPLKDVFVSFAGLDFEGNAILTIKYFPMQSWVWAGFALTLLGSGLAVWPKRRQAA